VGDWEKVAREEMKATNMRKKTRHWLRMICEKEGSKTRRRVQMKHTPIGRDKKSTMDGRKRTEG